AAFCLTRQGEDHSIDGPANARHPRATGRAHRRRATSTAQSGRTAATFDERLVMVASTFFLLLLSARTFAQPASIDPPIVGRPENFSNIVGKYMITANAEPRETVVEQPITLTIKITGTGPAQYEPKRKYLHVLPDWEDDFYVENVPDEDRITPDE